MGNFQHNEKQAEALKQQVLQTASAFSVPRHLTRKQAWGILEKCLGENSKIRPIGIDFAMYWKIAASLLLLVVAGWVLYTFQEVGIQTARGEIRSIVLPDHSTVILNAGSILHYNTIAFYFTRTVNLSGEGFFKVEKGSTFEVVSPNGSTRVLGTQFNILCRDNRYEVSCVEGKVRVIHSSHTSDCTLTAQLQTRSLGKRLQSPVLFNPTITAWQKGEFYFDNTSLQEVFATLELQYNIRIFYSGDTSRTYTGYFTNKNLEEALQLVCLPLQLNYRILHNRQIQISTNTNF